jgi:hypothetical protein
MMEQFTQKSAGARRSAQGTMPGLIQTLGHKVRSREWTMPAAVGRRTRQFRSDITVRHLPNHKVIVTGTLSDCSLDLVACMRQDGTLEVKGYNGTLSTELTTRLSSESEVTIGGRRDGRRVEVEVSLGNQGSAAVREGAVETVAPTNPFEQLLSRIPSHMTALLRATMLYLMILTERTVA